MSRADQIIDLIDVGLQTPMPDPTYGEVSPVNSDSCFRCHRPPDENSDMCAGCRAFLLGDSEDDPTRPHRPRVSWTGPEFPRLHPQRAASTLTVAASTSGRLAEAFQRAVEQLNAVFGVSAVELERVGQALSAFTVSFSLDDPDDPPEDLPRRRHGYAAVCPRHGETRGGTCLRCQR